MSRNSFTTLEQEYYTFKSDLPELFGTHYGKWVAYHGRKRLGFGESKSELIEKFTQQGIPYEELLVRMAQPDVQVARYRF